ncbi:MAG: peptide chain release factor N(5)-glutamine methyltransferase, partial [Polyangiaceae bacterium]|nr:peptide chain release factor N(5)-glutamine methyltransferase [Polyangiaceae bacterium]
RAFEVSSAVLVPRPDTEVLVSSALALLAAEGEARILDLCTGSGILAITLAAERPLLRAIATDKSPLALEVAKKNAVRHHVDDRVELRRGDLFDPVRDEAPFDLIVSNPPYIPSADIETLDADVRDHEPRMALDGGADGFDFHRRLVSASPTLLVPGGSLLIEVGAGQAEALEALIRSDGRYEDVRSVIDYGGIARVVAAKVPSAFS